MKFPKLLLFSITFFICLQVMSGGQIVSAKTAGSTAGDIEAQIVWTIQADKVYRVLFSLLERGEWRVPVQVSEVDAYIFHPVSASGSQGQKWVVWTQRTENGNFLHYSSTNAYIWSPALKIKTGLRENRATSLVVDDNNIPWIAWEGANGGRSDVYWSRLEHDGWSAPEKIHADNTVPDIEPELALNSVGKLSLSWKTVKNGLYVTVSKVWNGEQWQTASSQVSPKDERLKDYKNAIPYPEFIQERNQARLYIKRDGRVSSYLLSNFNF
jgi:hypothetical protein